MNKRNTEFRALKSCPYIEVSRDGEVRFRKGQERYRGGSLRRPEEFVMDEQGNRRPIQWMIFKTFPDIPMRHVPESWKNE